MFVDGSREPLALRAAEAFRVVQLLEKLSSRAEGEPLEVEENGGGGDRPSPARAPDLVDASDQANATSEVVRNQARVVHARPKHVLQSVISPPTVWVAQVS